MMEQGWLFTRSTKTCLPRPHIDFRVRQVRIACGWPLKCEYRRIGKELLCTYNTERGCTHRDAVVLALEAAIQAYQAALALHDAGEGEMTEQMNLDDFCDSDFFGSEETRPFLPTPYVDQAGQVCFACWRPRYCKFCPPGNPLQPCIYYTEQAHGCTNKEVCLQTLRLHVQTYKTALQALENER